jgi:hypothetical protein
MNRRFPRPWTVEETAPCFIVRDANKQALAFVCCEGDPGRRTTNNLITNDEPAHRAQIAAATVSSSLLSSWLHRYL